MVNNMSKMSKIVESALKHKPYKKTTSNKDMADKLMEERSRDEDETYNIPKLIYHCKVKSREICGCQVITFNEDEDTKQIILYLHGGAYVNEIETLHIIFCDRLAKETGTSIYAPIYPLAPNHTYVETYDIVEKLYRKLLEYEKPVIIMGDSAGGGLSAAFSEYLAANKIVMPQKLVLISPWVDVSMSGDYIDYVHVDAMLGVEGLREMGKSWAGNLDTKDYRLSPLYGNVENLPETTIFVGTHEIFYPDVKKFYEKMKENDVDVKLIVGKDMSHVYPLYPAVPESKEAFNRIVEIIKSDND